MKKIIWFILTFVLLGIIIGIFMWLYAFRKADISVASKKADIEIKAADFLKNFTDNEETANKTYLDKVVLVSGIIDKITEDSTSVSIYLKNPQDMAGVMCGFNKAAIDKSSLRVGDTVRIKGICTGFLMDVVLNKCVIEK